MKTSGVKAAGDHKALLIMTSDFDIKCEVRKNFVSHWVLKGLPHEFICENRNTWDPHPVAITHPETVVHPPTILSDGARGPQISEHFNTIATQFPILKKHPETVKLLENFIHKALLRITNVEKVGSQLL